MNTIHWFCKCGTGNSNKRVRCISCRDKRPQDTADMGTPYERRVRELEKDLSTSDAQGVADLEFIKAAAVPLYEACCAIKRAITNDELDAADLLVAAAIKKARGA